MDGGTGVTTLVDDPERWVMRLYRARQQEADDHARSTERIAGVVAEARSAGVSWYVIGRGLGTSRQAAWSRWHEVVGE